MSARIGSDYGTRAGSISTRGLDKNAVMQRTVVLVHGAWHGAWCWERVIPLLDAAAVPLMVIDLPSVSHDNATLHDDADYVRGALDSIAGEAVLLGHSYGGAVISAAGVHPNVVQLVYLCAFALDVGESAQDNSLTGGEGLSELGAALVVGDGVLTVDPERALGAFYHDCAPDIAAAAIDRLRPQSLAALAGKVDAAAWREKPATYVVCTEDRALPLALQRSNAARIGESVDWPTSHSPFLSRPALVAELLVELCSR
jgi:pimeloyl-ACP methyl ester carboxylesterase